MKCEPLTFEVCRNRSTEGRPPREARNTKGRQKARALTRKNAINFQVRTSVRELHRACSTQLARSATLSSTTIIHRTQPPPPIPRHNEHSEAGSRPRFPSEPTHRRQQLSQRAGHPLPLARRPRYGAPHPSCRRRPGTALQIRSRTRQWRNVSRQESHRTCKPSDGVARVIFRCRALKLATLTSEDGLTIRRCSHPTTRAATHERTNVNARARAQDWRLG